MYISFIYMYIKLLFEHARQICKTDLHVPKMVFTFAAVVVC